MTHRLNFAGRRATALSAAAAAVVVALLLTPVPASAQWLDYPTTGIPRMPDGKPNLAAAVPRTPDGKPQLAGLWRPAPGMVGDIARNLKGDVPFQPWAADLYKYRRSTNSKDDPTANCIVGGVPRSDLVGYPFKILQVPGMVAILYEAVHSYRQIFSDGRQLPKDPNPTWFGYSVGRWDGDVFVVETSGFNDKGWLDNAGKPATNQLHVTEKFIRKDFGNMDIEITVNDPKAYTAPFTVKLNEFIVLDTELLDYVCLENERDDAHLTGK